MAERGSAMRLARATGFGLLALLAGCNSTVGGEPAPGMSTGGSVSSGGQGSGGSGIAIGGEGAVDACLQGVAVSPTPLRRLTRHEYDYAIRDLLGSSLQLAKDFPNDLPAAGFASNRADAVSVLGVEKLAAAAEAAAIEATGRLGTLLPCSATQPDAACARGYFADLARKAYRRSATTAELDELATLHTWGTANGGFAYGIQVGIERILQSPHFIYHLERAKAGTATASGAALLTGASVADRLAAFIWHSLPDAALLAAAEDGTLDTPQGILTQAQRMLADAKGHDGVVQFFSQWLDIEKLAITEKNPAVFPAYSAEMRTAMWQETIGFVDFVVRQGDARLDTLLKSDLVLPSGPLASFYGLAPGQAYTPLSGGVRSGVLTHPSVLAVHAHSDQTSPVKRGAFVRDRVLCTPLPDPPPSVNANPPVIDPNATTRQRFQQHRADSSCAVCHSLIDPVGFAFERYDAVGRYRTTEGNNLPIDTAGILTGTVDIDGPFEGATDLTQRLASSSQVRDCMVTQWLRYALRQHEGGAEACTLQRAQAAFRADGDLRQLITTIVQSDAFRYKNIGGAP